MNISSSAARLLLRSLAFRRIAALAIAACLTVLTFGAASAEAQGMQTRMDLREARMELRQERREGVMEIREARMDLREAVSAMSGVREARMELREERREARMEIREANMVLNEALTERNGERREANTERRRIRREARGRHWARVLRWNPSLGNAERPPAPMIAEARRHAWRVARLTRVRTLAMAAEDAAAVTRVDSLLARENDRHERRVRAMTPEEAMDAAEEAVEAAAQAAEAVVAPQAAQPVPSLNVRIPGLNVRDLVPMIALEQMENQGVSVMVEE